MFDIDNTLLPCHARKMNKGRNDMNPPLYWGDDSRVRENESLMQTNNCKLFS